MADQQQPPANPAPSTSSGPPLLYKNPMPLDEAIFGKYGFKANGDYGFARAVNSVPITLMEFQHVQRTYPIIYIGDRMTPCCVLGFEATENLFVDAAGKWAEDTYVPAYIRRYPFILAEVPNDDRRFLYADLGAQTITDQNPVLPFFANGKPTEVINQALEFCRVYQEEIHMTQLFSEEMQRHKLLKPTELRFTLADGTQRVAGSFISLDVPTFEALADNVIVDLRRRGLLPCVYFQQSSLNNWLRLHARKQSLTAANNNQR